MERCSCFTGAEQLGEAGRDAKKHFTSPESARRRWKEAGSGDLTCDESLERQRLLGMFLLPLQRLVRQAGVTPSNALKVQELYRKIMGCEIKY